MLDCELNDKRLVLVASRLKLCGKAIEPGIFGGLDTCTTIQHDWNKYAGKVKWKRRKPNAHPSPSQHRRRTCHVWAWIFQQLLPYCWMQSTASPRHLERQFHVSSCNKTEKEHARTVLVTYLHRRIARRGRLHERLRRKWHDSSRRHPNFNRKDSSLDRLCSLAVNVRFGGWVKMGGYSI